MRSLQLLNAIESTITRCASDTEILRTLHREFRGFLSWLTANDATTPLDPEGQACELFEQASAAALRMYNVSIARRESARADRRLTGEDGVEDAYTALIAAFADVHNVLEDVRDAMATIDAEKSPTVGQASNAEELLKLLKA